MQKKNYIVAKYKGFVKDGSKIYREGDVFPRRVEALIEAGILLETEVQEKEAAKSANTSAKSKSKK